MIARIATLFSAGLVLLTFALTLRYVMGIWTETSKVETLLSYVFTHVLAGAAGFLAHLLGLKK